MLRLGFQACEPNPVEHMKIGKTSAQSRNESGITRRSFVRSATALTLCSALEGVSAPGPGLGKELKPSLSPAVQMQFMRPAQLEKALREFPVAYVPFGLIEWHGRHLPLGNDALKAHGILVKAAEQFGGAVYPPIYFHENFPKDSLVPVIRDLFQRLKKTGFRVLLGVTGHNIQGQIDMINQALKPVVADGTVAGMALHEVSLSKGPESNSDHAAKWETSNMMFFYPELVDMAALGDGPLAPHMKPPDGIGGLDPRKHGSVEVGRRNVHLAAEAIGRKARELLEGLPTMPKDSPVPAITPDKWWLI